MKKIVIILSLVCITGLFLKCGNNDTSSTKTVAKDSTKIVEEECSADNLFPIRPPSNAEPTRLQECEFYQWAWATFLYITQDSIGKPRFLSYETPTKLFPSKATSLFVKSLDNGILLLAPRIEEDSVVTSSADVEQAISKGVLIDKDGSAIYYAQHINSTFVNFVTQNHFTNPDILHEANPNLKFDVGSLELKSSWKIIMPGDDTSGFYTTTAMVAQFETKIDNNGRKSVVINPNNLKPERVELLGIHVVGVTEGHPEFIWATFEHDNLAPNNNNPTRNDTFPSSNVSGTINDMPLDSSNNYLFYTNGTSAIKCNNKTEVKNLQFQDQAKQTFKNISTVFHQFWFDDDGLIKSLNENVHAKLGSSSIWSHYSFKGAVWLNDPDSVFLPNQKFVALDASRHDTIIGGEKALSNITMETFTQPNQRCFSCHKTSDESDPDENSTLSFPGKLISVSHVLTNAYFNLKREELLVKTKHK